MRQRLGDRDFGQIAFVAIKGTARGCQDQTFYFFGRGFACSGIRNTAECSLSTGSSVAFQRLASAITSGPAIMSAHFIRQGDDLAGTNRFKKRLKSDNADHCR